MKPSHSYRATQDGRVMVERSDRMWSTGEGTGKPLHYSYLGRGVSLHGCSSKAQPLLFTLAERSYSTFKVRRGSGEEIPLIQDKEQWLCFAGAAMKRYSTPKVRETQVRW